VHLQAQAKAKEPSLEEKKTAAAYQDSVHEAAAKNEQ
jgi:hypothetical protein